MILGLGLGLWFCWVGWFAVIWVVSLKFGCFDLGLGLRWLRLVWVIGWVGFVVLGKFSSWFLFLWISGFRFCLILVVCVCL